MNDPTTCRICARAKAPHHFVCRKCFNSLPHELRAGFAVLKLKSLAWLGRNSPQTAPAGHPQVYEKPTTRPTETENDAPLADSLTFSDRALYDALDTDAQRQHISESCEFDECSPPEHGV